MDTYNTDNYAHSFSVGDFISLMCAVVIGVAFFLMPWVSIFGISRTGEQLLSEAQKWIQNDVSSLWLLPIAMVLGGIAGIGGLWKPAQNITRIIALVAGVGGLFYYVIFFTQSNQSAIDFDMFGVGFWVCLFAAIGLVLQVFIPRPRRDHGPIRIHVSKKVVIGLGLSIVILVAVVLTLVMLSNTMSTAPFIYSTY